MAFGIITLSAFLSLVAVVSSAAEKCPGTANYTLSFYGLWKEDRHPNTPLPGNAHFSPLVGCSHGSGYVMWSKGENASAGVELVAETVSGNTSTLVTEINAKITAKKAWKLILPGGAKLDPEATRTGIHVQVIQEYSKVSIITMLKPSPDWFIGIDSLELCNNGTWRESMNVTMLPPWDAGTDNGTAFSDNNTDTGPKVEIFKITNNTAGPFYGPNPIPSLGEFRFVRTDEPVASTEATEAKTPPIPTESSVGKASFNFAVFTSAALMLALLF